MRAREIDHAWRVLDLVTGWVRHAEGKAGAALVGAGVVGGALFNLVHDRTGGLWFDASATGCAASSLVAGVCAGVALWPRLRNGEDATSPLYFQHIARQHPARGGPALYARQLGETCADTDVLAVEIAHQIWANAHVARVKYRWSGFALIALCMAIGTLGCAALAVAVVV